LNVKKGKTSAILPSKKTHVSSPQRRKAANAVQKAAYMLSSSYVSLMGRGRIASRMSLVISFRERAPGRSNTDNAFSASIDVVVADSSDVGLYGGDRHCGRLEEMA
jgi:hypothetical protein